MKQKLPGVAWMVVWSGLFSLILSGCGRYITPTPQPQPTPVVNVAITANATVPTPAATATPRPATPITPPTPTLTPTPVIYTIQSGDTLLKIANEFGVSTEDIQEANGIVDPRFLQIGQTLIIPPLDETADARPTPTPTPLPLDIETINFQRTQQGVLWCLGSVHNPGAVPLTEVVIEASLFDANGVLLNRETAYTQLDVLLPDSSAPFAIQFTTPPGQFAQYQVAAISGVPLTGENRYYFDLETFDLRGEAEGLAIYRINGQLRNNGVLDVAEIRLVTVAYDDKNRVLAQRQANLGVNLLRAGATTPFEIDLIIPAGIVDRYQVLAQGLAVQ